jgi:hypothetical protein
MNRESFKIPSNPKHFWQEIADKIGGDFKITQQKQNFGIIDHDYYHLRIFTVHHGLQITLHSTFMKSPGKYEDCYTDRMKITSEIQMKDKFYLYLWRKGFFEKLFSSGKSKTGDSTFDSTIGFETNKGREVRNLLSNSEIRKFLIQDHLSVFNIQHDSDLLKIKLQTGKFILNKEILLEEYEKYLLFIDGLIEVGLLPISSQS